MSMPRFAAHKIIAPLLIVPLALLLLWLWRNLEWVEETTNQGWSVRAHKKPYLAAEYFLKHAQKNVRSSYRLGALDKLPAQGALVVSDSALIANELRVQQLLAWVNGGGQLIVAPPDSDKADRFLTALGVDFYFALNAVGGDTNKGAEPEGVEREINDETKKSSENVDEEALTEEQKEKIIQTVHRRFNNASESQKTTLQLRDEKERGINLTELRKIQVYSSQPSATVYFKKNHRFEHSLLYTESNDEQLDVAGYALSLRDWQEGGDGWHYLLFKLGGGWITVLPTTTLWDNYNITLFDNAQLLLQMTQDEREVAFLYGAQLPSLWQTLWRYLPASVVLWLLFFVVWYWRASLRMGPVIDALQIKRRALIEHAQASASYISHCENGRLRLLAVARDAVLAQVKQRWPGLLQSSTVDAVEFLAAQVNIPVADIQTVLFTPIEQSQIGDDDIIYFLNRLQRIGQRL